MIASSTSTFGSFLVYYFYYYSQSGEEGEKGKIIKGNEGVWRPWCVVEQAVEGCELKLLKKLPAQWSPSNLSVTSISFHFIGPYL